MSNLGNLAFVTEQKPEKPVCRYCKTGEQEKCRTRKKITFWVLYPVWRCWPFWSTVSSQNICILPLTVSSLRLYKSHVFILTGQCRSGYITVSIRFTSRVLRLYRLCTLVMAGWHRVRMDLNLRGIISHASSPENSRTVFLSFKFCGDFTFPWQGPSKIGHASVLGRSSSNSSSCLLYTSRCV